MPKIIVFSFISLLSFLSFRTVAQCPSIGCTTTISGADAGTYTITAGQKFCLAIGANFTGTLNLHGGVMDNCASVSQTFSLNTSSSFPSSIINNYGSILFAAYSFQDATTVNNYGAFDFTGNLRVESSSIFNNYGSSITNGTITSSSNSTINNYSSLTCSGEFRVNSGTKFNSYDGNLNCNQLTNSGNIFIQGSITSTTSCNLNSSSNAILSGGCMTCNDWTNNTVFHGDYCGTVTVTGLSRNNSTGSITGYVAINDNLSFPFVDINGGSIDPTVIGGSCGCPEVCGDLADDDMDCLIDCEDPDCGVSLLERQNNEAIQFAVGQDDFTSSIPDTTDRKYTYPRDVVQDPVSGKIFTSEFTNNRVLRFASLNDFLFGNGAEAVFGQVDFVSNTASTTATGMNHPQDLFVDDSGILWVADGSNSRVLRFDDAANKASGSPADGVLGQPDFISSGANVNQWGFLFVDYLFVDDAGTLWTTDRYRVMRFDNAAAKPNGANADGVLGQDDFTTTNFFPADTVTYWPMGVTKVCNRLYVTCWGGNRVVWWDDPEIKADGARIDGVIGQADFNSTTGGLSQTKLMDPTALMADKENNLYISDGDNYRIVILKDVLTKSYLDTFDRVLGQPDFVTNNYGVTQTMNTRIAGTSILSANGREYLAATDISGHRFIVWGHENLISREIADTNSVLPGSDPASTGSLTFAILTQPGIGSVTLDDPSTGAFTYNSPGSCPFDSDTATSFQYSITNGNACVTYSSFTVRIKNINSCGEICNNLVDDDGDGDTDCADSDCIPATPASISSSNILVCEFDTAESYSIDTVAGATLYTWSVPFGATITYGQGTDSIRVDWGVISGNVCVYASNASCSGLSQCTFITVKNTPDAPISIIH